MSEDKDAKTTETEQRVKQIIDDFDNGRVTKRDAEKVHDPLRQFAGRTSGCGFTAMK